MSKSIPTLCIVSLLIGCSAAHDRPSIRVGVEPDDGGSRQNDPSSMTPEISNPADAATGALDSSATGPLLVHIEGPASAAASSFTLPCGASCIEVEAVAVGGNAPYTFAWDDGVTNARRPLCANGPHAITVTATDTGRDSTEFNYKAQTVSSRVALEVMSCPDSGTPATDASRPTDPAFGSCKDLAGATCEVAPGVTLPQEITLNVRSNQPQWFRDGAKFPAGRYRISYVDGCNTYGPKCRWTIHSATEMLSEMNIVAIGMDLILALAPGTVGACDADTAFESYGDCVAANCMLPPLDFDYPGGPIAIQRNGGADLEPSILFNKEGPLDDLGGETVGGRSPTYRLTKLDPCP
jgi:hypothetical protein